jgi:hypothetical protein
MKKFMGGSWENNLPAFLEPFIYENFHLEQIGTSSWIE